ncbi:MAG: hypothetical protein IJH34_14525 [Romboutsia sp.]|nr:hypothetical protein [Romboutsia sp.]
MASGSESVGIDDNWHTDYPPRRKVEGTLSASYDGLTISCSTDINQYNTATGYSAYSDIIHLQIDGVDVDSTTVPMVPGGSRSLSGSRTVDPGIHTITVVMECGDSASCPYTPGYTKIVGSITFDVPSPEVPPTNITWGAVYNQSGVQNGNEKPDREFYVNWGGESAGTHTISQYNLDIYKSTDLNTIVATEANVGKNVRYNFETYLPKCKPGETYVFFLNILIDNSYWLGRTELGRILLYKDGIVYYKNGSGTKIECTSAYNKNISGGTKNKSRYILVKDMSGTKRVIDMYTTHYE